MTRSTKSSQSWPLARGSYLSTPSVSRNSVSTGPAVNAVRGALRLDPGSYDAEVRERVMKAQEKAGVDVTGVVTAEDWDLIVNGKRPRKPDEPADD